MKRCSKCNLLKSSDEFYQTKNERASSDGYNSWCKQCMREYHADWYLRHKKRVDAKNKQWRKLNLERGRIIEIRYAENYPDRRRESYRKWEQKKYHNSPVYRINKIMASGIRRSLNGNKSSKHWEKLVGYNANELKYHLELQFQPGMTWKNHGDWHIDHIIPISSFDFQMPEDEDFKVCWGLNNLQPLWAKDNLEKSAKIF